MKTYNANHISTALALTGLHNMASWSEYM